MGTSGQISVLSDQYFTAEGIEARPFLHGTYLLAGASIAEEKRMHCWKNSSENW